MIPEEIRSILKKVFTPIYFFSQNLLSWAVMPTGNRCCLNSGAILNFLIIPGISWLSGATTGLRWVVNRLIYYYQVQVGMNSVIRAEDISREDSEVRI